MRSSSTRALILTLALLMAVAPAGAGWEYHGSAGFNLGRADNPAFAGGCNPNYNPSSPLCALPPGDPRYDPIVCEPTLSGDAVSGDYTGAVAMTGVMAGTWAGTAFDLVYAPGFYVYQTGDLNQLSHALLSKLVRRTGPRGTFLLSEDFTYTPEQEVDPNALAEGRVLLNRTTRITNDARAGYEHEVSARTSLGSAYRYSIRRFGSERFTDSESHNLGLRFTGRFSSRTSLGIGYDVSLFEFDDGINPAAVNNPEPIPPVPPIDPADAGIFDARGGRGDDDDDRLPRTPSPPRVPLPAVAPLPAALAPGSSTAGLETPLGTNLNQVFIGWGYDSTDTEQLTRPRAGRPGRERRRGAVYSLSAGWGRLIAPDAEDGTYSAPYVDGSFSWHTLPLSTTFGYLRGLTDGGGAFANAETQNIYGDFRLHVAREWTGILSGSYLVNEQVEFGEAGSLGDAKVRTISTRAGMEYDLTERWVLNGSLTWFHQEICGDPCAVAGRTGIPELSTFRIIAGFIWYTE